MADLDPALVEKAAEDAARIFGWQHLARYSGQSPEWLEKTLAAMVAAVVPVVREALLNEVRERIGMLGVRRDSAEMWGVITVLHLIDDMAAEPRDPGTSAAEVRLAGPESEQ